MSLIWNKKELIRIKQIILNKSNYSLTEENNLKKDKVDAVDVILEDLFYIDSREKVKEILNSLKGIVVDYNNPLHYGLIASLNKIDVEDHTYIFEIYKQITSQYSRVISKICKEHIINLNSTEIIDRINLISSSDEETELEKQIKNTMNKILSYVPQLRQVPVYNSLIDECDKSIKDMILLNLNQELVGKRKNEEYDKSAEHKYYVRDCYKKYQRLNMKRLKESYSKFY